MTAHYLDIHLQPDPDFPPQFLMGALFGKLHRALATLEANDIGVSFPQHKTGLRTRTPGGLLRVHANADRLTELMEQNWLRGMRDHIAFEDVHPVPEQSLHRTVRRRQFKTNADRLRRRRMRRHNEDEQTVLERIPDSVERRVPLPFVQVRSSSSGERFSLFIEHGPTQSQPSSGHFNSYGLSREATIPWF